VRKLLLGTGCAVALISACGSAPDGPPQPLHRDAPPSATAAVAARDDAPVAVPTPRAAPTPPAAPRTSAASPPPCARNTALQKVIVSVRAQHAWMCARHRAVYDTPVTTGIPGEWTSTPTGNYAIQGRNTDTVLTLNTGAQYHVRYWIPFDAPLFGFHDSSWQRFPYGSAKYRTRGSHGCIHMPLRAMRFLYAWAARPTSVHIT
jgi:lipoprotein-anchoring transpeptidase ErfK/SrfK